MAEPRCWYLVLLIPLLTGLALGSANISICNGDSVQLFDRVQINDSQTIVELWYKKDIRTGMIASWNIEGNTITQNNIILDELKNIWIKNADSFDKGTYSLVNKTDKQKSYIKVVQLSVLVAPKTTCKPKIEKLQAVDHVLTASLEAIHNCGDPTVIVYWLNHSGVEYNDKLAKLPIGKEAGTYYACIGGPALSCVRNEYPTNHCSPFDVETSSNQSGTRDSKNDNCVVAIVISVLEGVALAFIIIWCLIRTCRDKGKNQENRGTRERDKVKDRDTNRDREGKRQKR